MTAPTEHSISRLTFIREIYLRAVETSHEPEPVDAMAILGFHDAVELFLQLAAGHMNVNLPSGVDFKGYWSPINGALGGAGLAAKVEMLRLNEARRGLKHHGNRPAPSDIESHRAATTTFFETNTPAVFDGLAFDELDMIQLVTFERTRVEVIVADELAGRGEFYDALGHLAVAFVAMLNEYRQRSGLFGYANWANISGPSVDDSEMESALEELASDVEDRLEELIEIVALGIDLRHWRQFRGLTPPVRRGPDPSYVERARLFRLPEPSRNGVEFCRRFVVDAALRVQALPRL